MLPEIPCVEPRKQVTGSPGVLLVPSAASSQCSYRGTGESWTIQDMVLPLSAGAFMGGGGGGKESNSKEQCIKWNSEHFLTTKLTLFKAVIGKASVFVVTARIEFMLL